MTGPQCGNERNWRVCERLYRLLAVTFSLFRHPPRGGSADATFPRWGKEGAARIRSRATVGAGVLDGPRSTWEKFDSTFGEFAYAR